MWQNGTAQQPSGVRGPACASCPCFIASSSRFAPRTGFPACGFRAMPEFQIRFATHHETKFAANYRKQKTAVRSNRYTFQLVPKYFPRQNSSEKSLALSFRSLETSLPGMAALLRHWLKTTTYARNAPVRRSSGTLSKIEPHSHGPLNTALTIQAPGPFIWPQPCPLTTGFKESWQACREVGP